MSSSAADALGRVPLFAGMPRRDLERLAGSMTERTVPAGTPLTVEDRGGVGFFVITDGRATVTVRGEERATLGPGDHFGEMALIDGANRSAQVTADTDVRCYGMTSWHFRPFVKEHPEVAWTLLETLVARLREAQARDARAVT